jgi:hypothetical protein
MMKWNGPWPSMVTGHPLCTVGSYTFNLGSSHIRWLNGGCGVLQSGAG